MINRLVCFFRDHVWNRPNWGEVIEGAPGEKVLVYEIFCSRCQKKSKQTKIFHGEPKVRTLRINGENINLPQD